MKITQWFKQWAREIRKDEFDQDRIELSGLLEETKFLQNRLLAARELEIIVRLEKQLAKKYKRTGCLRARIMINEKLLSEARTQKAPNENPST